MDQYEGTQSSVIGVQTVPENETHRYGIIDPVEQNERRYQVRQFVEKPAEGTAPSNLAIMGRYVLTPEILCFSKPTNRYWRRNSINGCDSTIK